MEAEFHRIVERELDAGYALFEVAQDEEAALRDSWRGDDRDLKVQPGRVGVVSAAQGHQPEIVLTSFEKDPGPHLADGYEMFGQVDVDWTSGHVELWTSLSDIGPAGELRLPRSESGRFVVRVSRTFAPEVDEPLDDYLLAHLEELDDAPVGLERWRFDFWPA